MNATEILQQSLSPRQVAERLKSYHELMQPWVDQHCKVMAVIMPKYTIFQDGRIETVYAEKDQELINRMISNLKQVSDQMLKSLGLATPPGDG